MRASRPGTRGRPAAWLWRDRRHVGAACEDLARDHTVVVPDLRGMGLSAKPAGGYDKKTQAGDVAGILDALKIERAALVTHDIGNMVGYAFAAQYRDRVTCFVVIDAPPSSWLALSSTGTIVAQDSGAQQASD